MQAHTSCLQPLPFNQPSLNASRLSHLHPQLGWMKHGLCRAHAFAPVVCDSQPPRAGHCCQEEHGAASLTPLAAMSGQPRHAGRRADGQRQLLIHAKSVKNSRKCTHSMSVVASWRHHACMDWQPRVAGEAGRLATSGCC